AAGEALTFSGAAVTLIEHWNGTQWSVVLTPNAPGENTLQDVTCTGAGSCMAVGRVSRDTTLSTLAMRLSGGRWSITPTPSPGWAGRAARRPRPPRYSEGRRSRGTSWSADVSDPCMPISEDSSGSALVATIANGPTGAATTSPIRAASASGTGPNQPASMARALGSTQARSPMISAQAAATSAAAPGAAYTCLALGSPPSSATPSRSAGSASTSMRSSGPTSTMPWSAVTYSGVPAGRGARGCPGRLSPWPRG